MPRGLAAHMHKEPKDDPSEGASTRRPVTGAAAKYMRMPQ